MHYTTVTLLALLAAATAAPLNRNPAAVLESADGKTKLVNVHHASARSLGDVDSLTSDVQPTEATDLVSDPTGLLAVGEGLLSGGTDAAGLLKRDPDCGDDHDNSTAVADTTASPTSTTVDTSETSSATTSATASATADTTITVVGEGEETVPGRKRALTSTDDTAAALSGLSSTSSSLGDSADLDEEVSSLIPGGLVGRSPDCDEESDATEAEASGDSQKRELGDLTSTSSATSEADGLVAIAVSLVPGDLATRTPDCDEEDDAATVPDRRGLSDLTSTASTTSSTDTLVAEVESFLATTSITKRAPSNAGKMAALRAKRTPDCDEEDDAATVSEKGGVSD